MFHTVAYIPTAGVDATTPNTAYRNGQYWRGEVEACREVAVYPSLSNREAIEAAYTAAGVPVVEWSHGGKQHYVADTTQRDVVTGMWSGLDVVVVGGGPSLKGFDFARLKDFPCKIIAVNRAYEVCDPDIIFSMDKQFWDWSLEGAFGSESKTRYESLKCLRVASSKHIAIDKRVINIGRSTQVLSKTVKGGIYTGGNSGFAAIHLACILGASRVFVLGLDCAPTQTGKTENFHGGYPTKGSHDIYQRYAQNFSEYAPQLNKMSEIINCNTDSAVKCFPFGGLPDGAYKPTPDYLPPMTCFVTPAYRKVYKRHLQEGVDRFQLPLTLIERENTGNWKRNACLKPGAIIEAKQSDAPIVWLDSDSAVERFPVLFGKLRDDGVDFAAHTLPSGEMLSSVLYFGDTPRADALLKEWLKRCEQSPERYGTADQKHLQDACQAMSIDVFPLPASYCKIFDHPKQAGITEPVIVQWQASRKMKKVKP